LPQSLICIIGIVVAAVSIVALTAGLASAQIGSVTGRLTDTQGAAVVNAIDERAATAADNGSSSGTLCMTCARVVHVDRIIPWAFPHALVRSNIRFVDPFLVGIVRVR
jgi:hypothetical protein